jgi:RND family efflux transporter MFP subunit
MITLSTNHYDRRPAQAAVRACCWLLLLALNVGSARGDDDPVDGFTEPNRAVNVATAEVGVIRKIEVREGDAVKCGQVLATLDNEIHTALLSIAVEQMNARGRLESAQAELDMRQSKLEKLQMLREQGHARQEEVDRAVTDVAIAKAQVLSAQEELLIRKLEHERARLQLERRTIRSPLEGFITKAHKQEGEFVAAHDAVLFTIVQLDPLVATFSAPSQQVASLRAGQKVALSIAGSDARTQGTIDFISPVTDAESGTVRIKVRIDNAKGLYRSGERCTLHLPGTFHVAPR